MAMARQVHAKGLQAKLKQTEMVRDARATRAVLFGGAAVNDDVVSYVPSSIARSAAIPGRDASSVRISGNGTSVTARMLALTECQRGLLERRAISVTASEYRTAEGSDALAVFGGERQAYVSLHEMGFVRVQEMSPILPDRFYKVVNASSGPATVAWARVERSSAGATVYVHISLLEMA